MYYNFKKYFTYLIILLITVLSAYLICFLFNPVSKKLEAVDNILLDESPKFGQWMIDPQNMPANWLDTKYQGKELREPINIIIIDEVSTSQDEANKNLLGSCFRAGYESRIGHSSGYKGYIADVFFSQLPQEENHAFSNAFFAFPNNHGRVFGPCFFNGKYYFTAAFSRESIDLFARVKHNYASFIVARDDFAVRLSEHSNYKIAGKMSSGNAASLDNNITVGDHDGYAIVLILK